MELKLDDSGHTKDGSRYYTAHDTKTGREVMVLDETLCRRFRLSEFDHVDLEWMMNATFSGVTEEDLYDPAREAYGEYGSW
jgi:hypothetical protein